MERTLGADSSAVSPIVALILMAAVVLTVTTIASLLVFVV
jgi:FlaG/FlaF family flagellin (archaellin)